MNMIKISDNPCINIVHLIKSCYYILEYYTLIYYKMFYCKLELGFKYIFNQSYFIFSQL